MPYTVKVGNRRAWILGCALGVATICAVLVAQWQDRNERNALDRALAGARSAGLRPLVEDRATVFLWPDRSEELLQALEQMEKVAEAEHQTPERIGTFLLGRPNPDSDWLSLPTSGTWETPTGQPSITHRAHSTTYHASEWLGKAGDQAAKQKDRDAFLNILAIYSDIGAWWQLAPEEWLIALPYLKARQIDLLRRYGPEFKISPEEIDRTLNPGLPTERKIIQGALEAQIADTQWEFRGSRAVRLLVGNHFGYPRRKGLPVTSQKRKLMTTVTNRAITIWADYNRTGDEVAVLRQMSNPLPLTSEDDLWALENSRESALRLLRVRAQANALRMFAKYSPTWLNEPLQADTQIDGSARLVRREGDWVVQHRLYRHVDPKISSRDMEMTDDYADFARWSVIRPTKTR